MNSMNNTPRVQSFAATDKGRRPNNEDSIAFFEPTDPKERRLSGCIYIVADGVGGASIGERASKFAADKVLYEYLNHPEVEPASRLKQAIVKANREIFEYAEQNGIRMATTMTIAVILENQLIAANVGDSRVYLIRGGEVRQITEDHNLVGELVRNRAMTEEEALRSKMKNKLTRSIGGSDEVDADTFTVPLQAGDKILLCSDGLTRYALRADIAKLASDDSAEQIVKAAIDFAKKQGHGGADNISVITVLYEPANIKEVKQAVSTKPMEDWEIRETLIKTAPPKPKPYLSIVIIVLLFFFAAGGGAVYFNRATLLGLLFPPPAPALPSGTPLPAAPASSTVTFTLTLTTDTPTPTLTATATVTGSPVATDTPAFTQMSTDTLTFTPSPLVNCVYTVTNRDTLYGIADKFEIGGSNYIDIVCLPNSDPSCDVDKPQSIRAGWQLVIPGVKPEICAQNGGTIQQ